MGNSATSKCPYSMEDLIEDRTKLSHHITTTNLDTGFTTPQHSGCGICGENIIEHRKRNLENEVQKQLPLIPIGETHKTLLITGGAIAVVFVLVKCLNS